MPVSTCSSAGRVCPARRAWAAQRSTSSSEPSTGARPWAAKSGSLPGHRPFSTASMAPGAASRIASASCGWAVKKWRQPAANRRVTTGTAPRP